MVFRAFISALMMVLILPWGAYGVGHAGIDLRIDNSQSPEITGISDTKSAELKARTSCRIAVLPGSPCGPDPILPVAMPSLALAPKPDTQTLSPDWKGQGRSLSPPRAPPRMI